MTNHIDIGSVLRRTVCDLYSNLVTRPTGAAVRREIENVLEGAATPSLTVIDFSQVGLLDFSCADEVIGKLLSSRRELSPNAEAYFLVRGAQEHHLEAIESAMARYNLAVLVESDEGRWQVVGCLDEMPRRALEVVLVRGRADIADVAAELQQPSESLAPALDVLWHQRLVMRAEGGYASLQSAL